ncbi:hypothetical protein CFK40_14135 [Virgibacillus necropolis]|uniref:Uncharacterized protein n=1 Tax=Virgibacillus necropolis TaxID=163877 RepID=A0A221MEH1_9BACI|nr:hypothetical protein CFK40_14135 [Virgibacillus necropolis]
MTDLNPKGIVSGGVASRAGKALGPLGVGLSYYTNYNDTQAEGLIGGEAHARASVDTMIDMVVSGTGLGIAANWALSIDFGKSDKSIMDRAKGAFHKLTGWFS